jgi:FMN phosphatase YigB (HAD superfamily)
MGFGGVAPMKELAGIDSEEDVWRRWQECPWVNRFERGECSELEFAKGVVESWRLPLAPLSFLDAYRGWHGRQHPGANDLLREVQQNILVGCLTNTNSILWSGHCHELPALASLDFRFLSCELGALKPHSEIFEAVASRLPMATRRVLFLDDNLDSVVGAARLGFVSRQARGVDHARHELIRAGVLAK